MIAIIPEWRNHGAVVKIPRSGWFRELTEDCTEDPRITSKVLPASLSSVNVSGRAKRHLPKPHV